MHERTERRLVWCFALAAVVRIALGALSFPFFGHIDEVAHVDTVFKYARGQLPAAGADAYDDRTVELFAFASSPEYLLEPGANGVAPIPMQFDWTAEQHALHLAAVLDQFRGTPNHNAFEPPVYYLLAAGWLRLGELAGLDGTDALYWLRMLGALAFGGAVLASAALARRIVPERALVRLGVPLLVMAWPQDVLYFVNNDVLSPLAFALSVLALWRVRTERNTPLVHVAIAGAVTGIAFLIKPTNVTLVVLGATLLAWPPRRPRRLLVTTLFAAVPVALWHGYLFASTGLLSSSTHKTSVLGCGPQSWDGIVAHPIWSPGGAWTWAEGVATTFWRGEIQWHGEMMRIPALDATVCGVTLVLALASLVTTIRGTGLARAFAIPVWLAISSGFAMLIVLSVSIDFGPNTFPSRAFPYLIAGRLLSGLFPMVAILISDGLDRLTVGRSARTKWIALALLAATLLAYELIETMPVASSPHNFWHLDR